MAYFVEKPVSDFTSSKTPLFLVPAWGTDGRIWHNQLQAELGPVEPIVLKWIEPEPRESLASYAARLAKLIDPGKPCYLAGLSFGGMLAVEMSQHLDARACILIGSIPSGDRLPFKYCIFRRLNFLIPKSFWSLAHVGARLHLALCRKSFSENRLLVYQQFFDMPVSFFDWIGRAILGWRRPDGPLTCPMYHIHGDKDWVLPIRYVEPDTILSGAGHCLPLTHPDEVNEYIAEVISDNP